MADVPAGVDGRDDAQRAVRGTLWVAGQTLLSNVMASSALLVSAAYLAPDQLGVLALGQLVFVLGNTLQDVGLWDVLIFTREPERAAAAALCVLLVVSVGLATAVALLSPVIADFFGEPRATPVIAVAGVLLVCYALADVPFALRTRALQLRERALVQGAAVVLGGTVSMVLVVAGVGIAGVVAGQVVQAVALLLGAWGWGPRVRPRWDRAVARDMLAYGKHSFGSATLSVAQVNVDYVFVGRVLGSTALGVYSLAFRLSYLPYLLVARVVQGTAFSVLCRLEGPEAQGREMVRYLRVTLLLLAPLCASLALLAPQVALLGDEWRPTVPAVQLLAGYTLATALASLAAVGLKAAGRPDLALVCAASHLASLCLGLLLLTGRGVVTVTAVRLVVAAAVLAVTWGLLRRVVELPGTAARRAVTAPLAGVLAMAAAVGSLRQVPWGQGVGWRPLVLTAAGALVAYALVVAAADRQVLRDLRLVRAGGPA